MAVLPFSDAYMGVLYTYKIYKIKVYVFIDTSPKDQEEECFFNVALEIVSKKSVFICSIN